MTLNSEIPPRRHNPRDVSILSMCMLAGWALSLLRLPQDHEQHCIYPISGSPVNLKCICERNQNQRRQRRNMQTAYVEDTRTELNSFYEVIVKQKSDEYEIKREGKMAVGL